MPIQAHSLPWASLASCFEYRPAKSGVPGDQRADLFLKHNETQVQQLEHFAAAFRDVLQDHTQTARRKLRSSGQYFERACKWQFSAEQPSRDGDGDSKKPSHASTGHEIAQYGDHVIRRTQLLRYEVYLLGHGWATIPETRPVLRESLVEKYDGYRRLYLSSALDKFRGIEPFTRPDVRPSEQTHEDWNDDRAKADAIKVLTFEAAARNKPWEDNRDLETLMLLAHHPKVKLSRYMDLSLSCCNIGCGVDEMQALALKFLVLFGLVEKKIADGDLRLTAVHSGRPEYTTLVTYQRLMKGLLSEHEHLGETTLFRVFWGYGPNVFLAAKEEQLAVDVLANPTRFAELTKTAWKVLIITNMLNLELGYASDWKRQVLWEMDDLFSGQPMGDYFYVYEQERYRPDEASKS